MPDHFDIAIIGGGPGGATAAALLAAAGFSTVICEGKNSRAKVCGEFISAKARPILHRLQLLPQYNRHAGPPVRFVAACAPGAPEPIFAAMPRDPNGAYPSALSRARLDEMLLSRAAELGAHVRQPCHVLSVQGSLEGFLTHTATGNIHSQIVVLAHGLAQRGDMAGNQHQPPLQKNYLNFKTHFANSPLPHNTIAIAGGHGIYAGLVRSSEDRFSLAFVLRKDRIRRLGNSPDRHLAQLLLENPTFARFLDHARPLAPWMASGPLEPGVRQVYSAGRFFVGNAAGEVHALVGEGITLAMQGAELLAQTLENHGLARIDAAGRQYAARWRQQFSRRYAMAQAVANLMMRPWLADIGAQLCAAFPSVLPAAVRWTGK